MVDGYLPYFEEVKNALSAIGFTLEGDHDFFATFGNTSDWTIMFEGERFNEPAFSLILLPDRSGKKNEFSVRIMMKVFGIEDKPSLSNQLLFIAKRKLDLMPPTGEIPYEAKYNRLNEFR